MPSFLISRNKKSGKTQWKETTKKAKVLVVKPVTKRKNSNKRYLNHLWAKSPFAPIMNVEMVYSEVAQLKSGVGGVFTSQIYRANDMFDPYFTGVGHQPYGRDTLATLYNKYKVLGVKVELTFTDPKEDGIACALMTSSPNEPISLAGLTVSQAQEKPNVTIKFLNNTGNQITKINHSYPMHRLAQITPLQFKANIDTYAGLSSASPDQTPYIRVGVADVNDNINSECMCLIKFTYYTQWYDRKILSSS